LLYFQDGANFSSHTGICVVDLTPQVGNFFQGFIEVEKGVNSPMIYPPIFHDSDAQEWFDLHFTSELAGMFQKGEMTVNNVERLGVIIKTISQRLYCHSF
jgi:hypothetical protein